MNQTLKTEIQNLFDRTPEDITSVSYGYKYISGEKTNQLSIIFGVNKKKPYNQLNAQEILPKEILINGVKYLTDVVEREIPVTHTCYTNASDPEITRLQGFPSLLKPMRGGQEIIQFPTNWSESQESPGSYNITVGTLGFFAVDNTDDKVVGVTNSHAICYERLYCDEQDLATVISNPYNTCLTRPWTNVSSDLYFPGAVVRNNNNPLQLAASYIKRYKPVSNSDSNIVDGALLIMNNSVSPFVDNNSYMIWQPTSLPDYTTHMPFATSQEIDNLLSTNPLVYSTGRTTGPKGYGNTASCRLRISELHVSSLVNHNGMIQSWTNCIKYTYEDNSQYPSDSGDSGSAVIAEINGQRKIIGLLFAGSTTFALANRIDDVASALNIRAWDSSYVLNKTLPTPVYRISKLSSGYGHVDSVNVGGTVFYQAGFTNQTSFTTLPPLFTTSTTTTTTYQP